MKKYRYIWLPLVLLAYGLGMAWWFGPELSAAGRVWQVWTFVGVDVVVCLLLSVFIYKRSRF